MMRALMLACLGVLAVAAPARADAGTTDPGGDEDGAVALEHMALDALILGWPGAPPDMPELARDPVYLVGHDTGLIASGLVLFGLGYLGQLVVGVAEQSRTGCYVGDLTVRMGWEPVTCESGLYASVPVIGAFLAGMAPPLWGGARRRLDELGAAAGPPLAAAQVVGIVLLAIGVHVPTRAVVARSADAAALSVAPWASAEGAGATLEISF
jgi:hypothetical protein